MSESQWKTVGRQHRIRVDHRGHASLIAESTCAIAITIHQLLQQLNDRAKSLTACAQYDLALKDAAVMREMAPRSCLCYLRACDVYSSQGRQREVIDMCKRGLFAISHDDPDFQQLRVIKSEAQIIH
ncbi:predicted protein [Lichtheimia corymbifera JMRC:FSU:9682]|uniref:Uncharacterized protein n=1 Tax=Lichtheimia corymbifera JMRC:FSU:9682 TaxID=1263082 RepID=A0A068S8X3_9FUNG|nr:predicted protein [Lichtheimia corymbifera JMRC:FSU:9682]